MERLYKIQVDETMVEGNFIADEYEWGGRAGKEQISTDMRFYGNTPRELAEKIIENLPPEDTHADLFEETPYFGCRVMEHSELVDFQIGIMTASRKKNINS